MKKFHGLTEEEKHILEEKGTEKPGSGLLLHEDRLGLYICKKCDAPLYLSSAKFESHCGWPSFEEEIPKAVMKKQDADRTEILCANCLGHLGHVFTGELLTKKNTRHCVNSLSLRFIPAIDEEGFPKAIFAAGCFWGVEHFFQKIPGVIKTKVGYIGGQVVNPTYEEVCSGKTDHIEAIELSFDPDKIHYQDLVSDFFTSHSPTKQDPRQYRSAIFYLTQSQKLIALKIKEALEKKLGTIYTEILPASLFYLAENYHQNYYKKNQ